MGVWLLVRRVVGLNRVGQPSDQAGSGKEQTAEETKVYRKINTPTFEKRRYRLVVIVGRDQGREFLLMPTSMKIGRKDDCFIHLSDTKASREHAVLHYRSREEQFTLEDLGSTNGTFLNDRRVKREFLSSGDIIKIGATQMQFLLSEPQEASKH